MKKQITSTTGSSLVSYIFASLFGIAGLVILGYGVSQLSGGSTQQFGVALLLGGGFLAISVFVIRARMAESKKTAWLNKNGVWITAKPINFRTVTSDESGKVTSFCLILKAVGADQAVSGLANLEFESLPIYSRFLSDNYHEKECDIVVDPAAPGERYHVNANLQTLLS